MKLTVPVKPGVEVKMRLSPSGLISTFPPKSACVTEEMTKVCTPPSPSSSLARTSRGVSVLVVTLKVSSTAVGALSITVKFTVGVSDKPEASVTSTVKE